MSAADDTLGTQPRPLGAEAAERDLESELMGPRDPRNAADPRNFDAYGNRLPSPAEQLRVAQMLRSLRGSGPSQAASSCAAPPPAPPRAPLSPERAEARREGIRQQSLCSSVNFEARREAHERRKARWTEALEEHKRELEREERHERILIADYDRGLRRRLWTLVAALVLAGFTNSRWPPVGHAAVALFYLAGIGCFTLRDPRESIRRKQAARAAARTRA